MQLKWRRSMPKKAYRMEARFVPKEKYLIKAIVAEGGIAHEVH